jgi:hypothetical protein
MFEAQAGLTLCSVRLQASPGCQDCCQARIDNGRFRPTVYDLFITTEGAQQLFQFLERAPAAHKPSKSLWLPGIPRIDPQSDGWYWDDSIT